jgi:hypothetical protein
MMGKEENNVRTNEWEEFEAEFLRQVKGIRVKSLRKFLLFTMYANSRLNKIDWLEFKARDPEKRINLRASLGNYLICYDAQEIEYYERIEFGSKRTVRDYMKTLYRLVILFGLETL